jgi:DNA-binding transcriptional ArsR family regulator
VTTPALVFHALGDATRRDMVERLTDTALSLSALAAPYDMTLTAVSQHLAILEAAGLVASEKVGRVRTAKLNPEGLAVMDTWLKNRRSLWQRRLEALGDVLDET